MTVYETIISIENYAVLSLGFQGILNNLVIGEYQKHEEIMLIFLFKLSEIKRKQTQKLRGNKHRGNEIHQDCK